jgi:hypothetical protein
MMLQDSKDLLAYELWRKASLFDQSVAGVGASIQCTEKLDWTGRICGSALFDATARYQACTFTIGTKEKSLNYEINYLQG